MLYMQLDALEYLHDQGYVHADIKASNLLTGFKNKHEVIYNVTNKVAVMLFIICRYI